MVGDHPLPRALQRHVAEIEGLREGETLNRHLADYLYEFVAYEPFARMLGNENRARNLAIDLLINNAGFGARGEFWKLPLDRQVGDRHDLARGLAPDVLVGERGAGGVMARRRIHHLGDLSRSVRHAQSARMNVRDHGAIGLQRRQPRPPDYIGAEAFGGGQAGTLADDHAHQGGA